MCMGGGGGGGGGMDRERDDERDRNIYFTKISVVSLRPV